MVKPTTNCELCDSSVAVKVCDHCGKVECGSCRDACAVAKFLESQPRIEIKGKLTDRMGIEGFSRLSF